MSDLLSINLVGEIEKSMRGHTDGVTVNFRVEGPALWPSLRGRPRLLQLAHPRILSLTSTFICFFADDFLTSKHNYRHVFCLKEPLFINRVHFLYMTMEANTFTIGFPIVMNMYVRIGFRVSKIIFEIDRGVDLDDFRSIESALSARFQRI